MKKAVYFLEPTSNGICKNAEVKSRLTMYLTPSNCWSISSIGGALAQSGNLKLFTILASIQIRASLFSLYTIVSVFLNDESDNSNILTFSICLICFLTPALSEYGTGLEWPIIEVSVMLHVYSYTLHFPGLVVKNSVYLSSTSVSFSFYCFSKLLLLMINFPKSTSDIIAGPLNQLLIFRIDPFAV